MCVLRSDRSTIFSLEPIDKPLFSGGPFEADHSSCDVKERHIVFGFLLPADKNRPCSIDVAEGSFDHPASGFAASRSSLELDASVHPLRNMGLVLILPSDCP